MKVIRYIGISFILGFVLHGCSVMPGQSDDKASAMQGGDANGTASMEADRRTTTPDL